MIIQFSDISSSRIYHVMTQVIIPRPVAWVLSLNASSSDDMQPSYNLAPFSFFNGISSDPPVLMVSAGVKENGQKKDTWVNIEERDFFVVHIPSVQHSDLVKKSSEEFDYGVSETELLNIELEKSDHFPLPRIRDCTAAMFCKKLSITEVGREPQALIMGLIESVYISDDAAQSDGKRIVTDPMKINPLIRLGAGSFGSIGTVFR